jgi:phosphoglycerate dehydrogenase-like enzyme
MVPVGKAFGMRVLAWSQNLSSDTAAKAGVEHADSLDELCRRADLCVRFPAL